MSTSVVDAKAITALDVTVNDDTLSVDLSDGRTISVPLAWYPRLSIGTSRERASWRLIAGGRGIHWPELDEDISVENLISGEPSGESQASFNRWRAGRKRKSTRAKA